MLKQIHTLSNQNIWTNLNSNLLKQQIEQSLCDDLQISISNEFTFILTKDCNLNCTHCICCANQTKTGLNKSKIIQIIELLAKSWVKSLNLTWWEIFLYMEYLNEIFYQIWKNKLKLNTIKTNMYMAENVDYEQNVNNLFNSFFDWLLDAWVLNELLHDYIGHGLEVSLDRYHGNLDENIQKILKIININSQFVKSKSFLQNSFMCINMVRNHTISQDIKDLKKLLLALESAGYIVWAQRDDGSTILGINDVLEYLPIATKTNYLKLVLQKWDQQILIRLGLLTIFRQWKATEIISNTQHKVLENFEQDLMTLLMNSIPYRLNSVDFKWNLFYNEFLMYTGKMPLWNAFEWIQNVCDANKNNIILHEFHNHWLIRVLPILFKLIPDLKKFEYIWAADVVSKILSFENGYELLYKSCFLVKAWKYWF